MSRLGILGGTFNPVHLGHLIIAEQVKELCNLDKVVFIPNGNPPHKKNTQVDKFHRFEMLKLALKDNQNFEISDFEIKKEQLSYTFNTISELKKLWQSELFFIIGSDSLFNMPTWYKYKELLELCNFIVFPRIIDSKEDFDNEKFIKEVLKTDLSKFNLIKFPFIDISSTFIREKIIANKSLKYLIPDEVISYISTHKLYLD